jgi:4-hydroxy-2-oxoheptanedioate aldolase
MNAFKQAIADGVARIGLWQALASPYTCEICAGAGFDWLLIDAEHAPNTIPLVLAQLQAAAAYPVEPVVRLPIGDAVLVKQYLDIGARSLLIPMVDSAEAAAHMVAATRYPPQGFRGRLGDRPREPVEPHSRLSRTGRGRHLPAGAGGNACRSGRDCRDCGGAGRGRRVHRPVRSRGRHGAPRQSGAPAVQAAIESGIAAVRAAGKPVGMLIADEALARRYLELGASFVAVGTDVTILARGAEALARRFAGPAGQDAGAAGSGRAASTDAHSRPSY